MEQVGNLRITLAQGKNGPELSYAVEPLAHDSNTGHKPRIGISGSGGDSKSVAAIITQIRTSGAEPVFLGDHAARLARSGGNAQAAAASDLSNLDGLIVMGNNGDIDPKKYGAVVDPHTKVETDMARAAYEEAAITKALDSGMPLLGVCGGMQRINVLGGGTLHQHVPDLVGDNHHMQGDSNIAPFVPVQAVTLSNGSRLATIGGVTSSVYVPGHGAAPESVVLENSFHHQAVDKVRGDFRVNATSNDGIIEGIEPRPGSRYANQYVMGIQWHPEFSASDLGPKIAGSVTDAARAYAARKSAGTAEPQVNQQGYWHADANPANLPPPPTLMQLDPNEIKTDAASYQFRTGGNEKGVTVAHSIGDKWDPILGSEPLIVHQRLSGEYFVADGHHRLDLAQRCNAAGNGPGKLNALVLREADGYSVEDVKIIAAYKNMQTELSHRNCAPSEVVDGARVLREAHQKMNHPKWLPCLQMDKGDLHMCDSLSRLSGSSFNSVREGRVPTQMAAIIADSTPDIAQQDKAIQFVGDKLAQNYTITVHFQSNNDVPAPPPPAEPAQAEISGHVARLMQQRAQQAAMAR